MAPSEQFGRSGTTRLLTRILRKWREVGYIYATQIAIWKIFPGWLLDLNAWVVTATDIRHEATNKDHDPAIRWANESDIEALVACGLLPNKVLDAFRNGVRIAVYERNGRILVHGWYGFSAYDQDDWVRFQLAPGDMLGIRIWVRPDCRGHGLAPKVIRFVWSEMARARKKRSVGIINILNRNSRRAIAKNDGVESGRIFYVRFLGMTYVRYGAFRAFGFWNPARRLNLSLAPCGSGLANQKAG